MNFELKNDERANVIGTINIIQLEYSQYFELIVEHFMNNQDASEIFVEYFEKSHKRMHEIIENKLTCNKINDFLHDVFLMSVKYNHYNYYFDIPDLFLNYNAVYYYDSIKNKIEKLIKMKYSNEIIIDNLLVHENERHKNLQCDCGKSHECINENELRSLFKKLLNYHQQINFSDYQSEVNFFYN
tara:strand:- start:61 stop:615 length:555 start_codon:yes stop_codon:yes gene_type:complete